LMHRRARAFGRPSAGAASGGNLSLPWLSWGWCVRGVVLLDAGPEDRTNASYET
jgi:hypothetical protein